MNGPDSIDPKFRERLVAAAWLVGYAYACCDSGDVPPGVDWQVLWVKLETAQQIVGGTETDPLRMSQVEVYVAELKRLIREREKRRLQLVAGFLAGRN